MTKRIPLKIVGAQVIVVEGSSLIDQKKPFRFNKLLNPLLRYITRTLQHKPITLYLHSMAKTLITFLILILSCHTIGGFKGGRVMTCANYSSENSYHNRSLNILHSINNSSRPDPDHAEKENDNDDILEIPSFDMGCYRSPFLLRATIDQDNNNTHTEYYIRHYPWVVTEINTPPPKA